MGHRIYYEKFLRMAHYHPKYGDMPAKFTIHVRDDDYKMHFYEAVTLDDLRKQLKAGGVVIYGKDIEDYCHPPQNAYEYLLLESYLKAKGHDEKTIHWFMNLDRDKE